MYKLRRHPSSKLRWQIGLTLVVLCLQFVTPFSLLMPQKALAGPGNDDPSITILYNYSKHRTSVDTTTIEARIYNPQYISDAQPFDPDFTFKFDFSKKRYIGQYNTVTQTDYSCAYIEITAGGSGGFGGNKGMFHDNCGGHHYTKAIDIVSGIEATYITADVIDHSHFKIGGTTYFDAKTDDDLTYIGPDGCDGKNKIYGFYNHADTDNNLLKVLGYDPANVTNVPAALLMTSTVTSTINKNCDYTIQPVIFTHPENYRIYWLWKDKTTIGSTDGDWGYHSDPSNTLRFIENTSDPCPSYIDVSTIGAPTGKWVIRNDDVHDGWPNTNAEKKHDCTNAAGHDMTIGNVADAQKINSGFDGSKGGQSKADAQCDAGILTWLLCPIITLAQNAYITMETWVEHQLVFPALTPANYPQAYAVWGFFRNLANALFVLIFVIAIFATTTSFGPDSYTVKKVLPKLVMAAIFVAFSWVLMSIAVDITNIIGLSIPKVFALVPGGSHHTSSTGGAIFDFGVTVVLAVGTVVFAAALIVPMLLAVLALLVGIAGVFITIQLRTFIIIMLVAVSPLAFIAWVLPNTENLFKTWLKMLTRLLVMFPLITFIFSFAQIGVRVISGSAVGNSAGDTPQLIASSLLPIIAFYMVPWTFKWAGGAMSMAAGFIAGRAAGLSGAASSPLKDQYNRSRAQMKANSNSKRALKAATTFGKGNNKLTKAINNKRAQLMTGNFGALGKSKLAAASAGAKNEQVKAEIDKLNLETEGMTDAQKQDWLSKATKSADVNVSEAASTLMVQNGMYGGSNGLIALYGNRSTTDNLNDAAWQRTMKNNYDELNKKAGILMADGNDLKARINDFASKVSPEKLASTKKTVLQTIEDQRSTGGLDAKAAANLHTQGQAAIGNPRLSASLGPEEATLINGF